MVDNLGEALYTIKADDSQFAKTLQRDEQLAKTYVVRTQAELNKLGMASAQAGKEVTDSSRAATSALSGLGTVAALTGSTAVAASVQVGTLGIQLKELAASLGSAIARFGPYGAALAAIGTLIYAIYDRQRIADWIEGVDEANKRLDAMREKLVAQEMTIKARADAVKREIAILKGAKPSDLESNAGVAALLREKERLQAAIELRKQIDARREATRREYEAQQKSLAIDKQRNEEARTAQRLAEQKAYQATIGPQNLQDAFKLVGETARLIALQDKSRALREIAARDYAQRFGLDKSDLNTLLSRLGVSPDQPTTTFGPTALEIGNQRAGAVESRAFNRRTLGESLPAARIGGTSADQTKQRDTERNVLLKETRDAVRALTTVVRTGSGVPQ